MYRNKCGRLKWLHTLHATTLPLGLCCCGNLSDMRRKLLCKDGDCHHGKPSDVYAPSAEIPQLSSSNVCHTNTHFVHIGPLPYTHIQTSPPPPCPHPSPHSPLLEPGCALRLDSWHAHSHLSVLQLLIQQTGPKCRPEEKNVRSNTKL